MIKKITLLSLKFAIALGSFQALNAQIYTNGTVSTGATSASGVAAPAGYTWSELQSNTGNTTESNTSFGYSAYFTTDLVTDFAVADDFIVPAGNTWNVTGFEFYLYQTNYAGTVPPIDQLMIEVYNGDPATGGTLVAGDMATNVYDAANSVNSFVYRTGNSTTPAPGTVPGTARRIWQVRGNLTASLPAGTYWVVYKGHATNNAAFFFPPVTVTGFRSVAGWNGQQLTVGTSTWGALIDGGNPTTAPDEVQDMPFRVLGSVLGVNENEMQKLIATPNPVRDILNLSNTHDITSIEVFNMLGQKVISQTANAAQSQVDMSQLNAGTYTVKVMSFDQQQTIKVVKQ